MAISGNNDNWVQLQLYPFDPLFHGMAISDEAIFDSSSVATINANSVDSVAAVGSPTVLFEWAITASSVDSVSAIGLPTVTSSTGAVVNANSVDSVADIGLPTVSSTVDAVTIEPDSVRGVAEVGVPTVLSRAPVLDLSLGDIGPKRKKKKEEEEEPQPEAVRQTILRVIEGEKQAPQPEKNLVPPTKKQARKARRAEIDYEKAIIEKSIELLGVKAERLIRQEVKKIDLRKPVDDLLAAIANEEEEKEALELFQFLLEVA